MCFSVEGTPWSSEAKENHAAATSQKQGGQLGLLCQSRERSTSNQLAQGAMSTTAVSAPIPKGVEIEQAFVTWSSPARISKEYGVSQDSVYRHAHALGL